MPSHKGEKEEKSSKMPNMIDLASTGLRKSTRLPNKPKNMVYLINNY